jgi:FHA domain/Domain of unknown function (DUF4388)
MSKKFVIRCLSCDAPNPSGFKRCVRCKAELPEDEGGAILTWLCCESMPPVPLGAGPDISVGRQKGCSLVLPHAGVSRLHAVFRVEDGTIRLQDLSTNGTLVNGKRVKHESTLKVGDVVSLGPYDLELRKTPEGGADQAHTAPLDFSAFQSGALDESALLEVFQGIEFNRKTGTLTVVSGQLRGQLVVREGLPLEASLGQASHGEAVLQMLSLRGGRYTFSSAPSVDTERSMRITLTGLLLEHNRRLDELGTAHAGSSSARTRKVKRPDLSDVETREDPDEASRD